MQRSTHHPRSACLQVAALLDSLHIDASALHAHPPEGWDAIYAQPQPAGRELVANGHAARHAGAGWAEDFSRLRLGEPQPGAAGWAEQYAAQQVCFLGT